MFLVSFISCSWQFKGGFQGTESKNTQKGAEPKNDIIPNTTAHNPTGILPFNAVSWV